MPEHLPKLYHGRGAKQESLAGRARRSVNNNGKKKTQAQTEAEEIFSHFTLNKDPEASKYMPYDEVAYPSLLRKAHEAGALQESAPEELEAMWMSGHLDYLRRTEMKQVAASMRPFLELPGSTMLPGAAREQRRLEKKKRHRAREEAREEQMKRDRDFLGFPKKKHQLGKKRHEMREGEEDAARAVDPHGSLSEQEELRLKHLAKKLLFPPQKVNPYARTNRQLRRAAKTHRPRRIEPTMRCGVVSTLVNRYQEEAAAADVVCRAYRHYRRRELLKLRLEQNRVVVCIQTCARGYIARSLVALWHRSSIKLAVKWQARIRRALVVRDTNRLLQRQRRFLVTIHRAMRGFTGRIRANRRRWNLCALRIQVLWRGSRGRCVADRLWLDRHPIPIQRRVRGVLSRARFQRIKREVYTAALAVSRCFRGFAGRRLRNRLLYERESEALQSLLRLLASEAEQMTDKANKIEKRVLKKNLKEKAAEARRDVEAQSELVVTTESRYLLLISESERCTPRAIASGYRDEMSEQIVEHRKMITNHKSRLLFEDLVKLREAEETYAANTAVIARSRFLANEANLSRDCELKSIWARESRTHHDTAALDRRRAVGDQKRNWRVKFFNAEGKPRKRTAVGFVEAAGDETEVFCGGGVDLFAFSDTERHRIGSEEALAALDAKIRLQSWLNQVEQVEELFKPLHEPLKKMHRAASVMPDCDAGTFKDLSAIGAGRAVVPTLHGKIGWGAIEGVGDEERAGALVVVEDEASLASESTSSTVRRKREVHFQRFEPKVDAGRNLAWRDESDENVHVRGPIVVPLGTNLELSKKVKRRKRERDVVSRIPWSLLDELDAEKERFEKQRIADALLGGGM